MDVSVCVDKGIATETSELELANRTGVWVHMRLQSRDMSDRGNTRLFVAQKLDSVVIVRELLKESFPILRGIDPYSIVNAVF